jgi:hypothetical protein
MRAKAPRVVKERDARFYEIDGELYPSVTTVLQANSKPALVWWAASKERDLVMQAAADLYATCAKAGQTQLPRSWYLTALAEAIGPTKAHQKELEQAGDIGSQTHRLIEYTLRRAIGADAGAEPLVSKEALIAFRAWQEWAVSVRLKPLLIEHIVVSTRYQFAGTVDLLARVNGVMTEVSIKTGKSVYPEARLQSAAYRYALAEMGYPAVDGIVVRLPKTAADPSMEVVRVESVDELLPVFLSLQDVWQWAYPQDVAKLKAWKAAHPKVA